jgi:hypothetical protein
MILNHWKESAMTLKSQVAGIAGDIEQRAEELPARLSEVRDSLASWQTEVRRFARKNPGMAVVAAFVVGYGLAKVARNA